jgi:hypothetical protein
LRRIASGQAHEALNLVAAFAFVPPTMAPTLAFVRPTLDLAFALALILPALLSAFSQLVRTLAPPTLRITFAFSAAPALTPASTFHHFQFRLYRFN